MQRGIEMRREAMASMEAEVWKREIPLDDGKIGGKLVEHDWMMGKSLENWCDHEFFVALFEVLDQVFFHCHGRCFLDPDLGNQL